MDNPATEPVTTEGGVGESPEELASSEATIPLKRPPVFVAATLPAAEAKPDTVAPAKVSDDAATASIQEAVAAEGPEAKGEPTPEPEPKPDLLAVEFFPPPTDTHRASISVELRCARRGVEIRYALGVEDVDETGQLFNPAKRIFLTGSTKIAARAFENGKAGPLATAHYEVVKPQWEKNEPTDQSDPTPHEVSDATELEGPWRLAAASLRGRLHAHRGGWREDSFSHGLAHAADGTYSIVIVSDGAGSVGLARVGSRLLCDVSLETLVPALTNLAPLAGDKETLIQRDLPQLRELLVHAARESLGVVKAEAATRERPLSDFAATLLILVRREWNGMQLCAALQAGDGSIAGWNEDGTLTLLGTADHGEHSAETKFMTTNGVAEELPSRVKFSIRPQLSAVAVMSDGVADDYFPEDTRLADLFQEVLPLVQSTDAPGEALLGWIDYEKKGSSDDRTLVLCWNAESSEEVRPDVEP